MNPGSVSHAFTEIADRGRTRRRSAVRSSPRIRRGASAGRREREGRLRGVGPLSDSFTLDVYAVVLPGMGEQVASVIESALDEA